MYSLVDWYLQSPFTRYNLIFVVLIELACFSPFTSTNYRKKLVMATLAWEANWLVEVLLVEFQIELEFSRVESGIWICSFKSQLKWAQRRVVLELFERTSLVFFFFFFEPVLEVLMVWESSLTSLILGCSYGQPANFLLRLFFFSF